MFVRDDLGDVADIIAGNTVPGYKVSSCPPLAHGKVRFVGEAVAMCIAPHASRSGGSLPSASSLTSRSFRHSSMRRRLRQANVRVHDEWPDNCFLTLNYESGFASESKGAPVVVTREISLARQAMVPLEGKAVLACWDDAP